MYIAVLHFKMNALFNLPSADTENVQHFNQLLNTVNESINVFTSLKRPVKHWDDILVYCVTSKLPSKTHLAWAKLLGKNHKDSFPSFQELQNFLDEKFQALRLSIQK